jgi:hypothetical protein
MGDGTGVAEAVPDTGSSAKLSAWDDLITDLLENAVESWKARDIRGVVEVLGMAIRALERRVSLQ